MPATIVGGQVDPPSRHGRRLPGSRGPRCRSRGLAPRLWTAGRARELRRLDLAPAPLRKGASLRRRPRSTGCVRGPPCWAWAPSRRSAPSLPRTDRPRLRGVLRRPLRGRAIRLPLGEVLPLRVRGPEDRRRPPRALLRRGRRPPGLDLIKPGAPAPIPHSAQLTSAAAILTAERAVSKGCCLQGR